MELREKDQADFDLEKLFEMLDEALTSKDERVQNALRGLLTIIALTRTQDDDKMLIETNRGPLRRMQEDLKDISRRMWNIQEEVRQLQQKNIGPGVATQPWTGSPSPYSGQPYNNPGSVYTQPTTWSGGMADPTLWNGK